MTTIQELYAKELKQSEIDHKTPTAGAMTGHIIANLQILEQKIQQVKWYYVGHDKLVIADYTMDLLQATMQQRVALGERLLDALEYVPSVSSEFAEYTMLKEAGEFKYLTGYQMLDMLAEDLQTNLLFISRAIKLAEKENLDSLKRALIELSEYSKSNYRILKATNGFSLDEIRAALSEE